MLDFWWSSGTWYILCPVLQGTLCSNLIHIIYCTTWYTTLKPTSVPIRRCYVCCSAVHNMCRTNWSWIGSNRLKLNADKTQVIWIGSRLSRYFRATVAVCNRLFFGYSVRSRRHGRQPSEYVRSHDRCHSFLYVSAASTARLSDVPYSRTWWRHCSVHWSAADSTTATASLPVSRVVWWQNRSPFRMQQHDSSRSLESSTISRPYSVSSTGCPSVDVLISRWRYSSTSICKDSRHRI